MKNYRQALSIILLVLYSYALSWGSQPPESIPQRVQSALGIYISFANNKTSYDGRLLINDPRFIDLQVDGRIFDAVRYMSPNGQLYLLLLEIIKRSATSATINYTKCLVKSETKAKGLIIEPPNTHQLLYYSGYVLRTEAWKALPAGGTLTDEYCKSPVLPAACDPVDLIKITLTKPANTAQDLPVLTVIK